MIINFEESDSQKLESLLKYLKDFEKNLKFNETNKKITIILIHLKRKKEPYNKDIFISNLSDIPQTFIDDIYGKEILINDILGLNIKELYENKELIDTQELFREEIYNCFQKIKYIFKDNILDENKYKSTIILNIYNNKELINKIVEKIINEMEKSKEQINFCENIFRNNSFETQENFINIFSFELKNLFVNSMNKLIINSEKLSILSSLTKNLPSCSKTIWYNLFNDFDFSGEINKNIYSNNIKIFTKLNLPSFKSINFINDIIEIDTNKYIDEYLREETKIRVLYEPSEILFVTHNESIDTEEYEIKKNLIEEFFMEDNNNLNKPRFQDVKKELEKFIFLPNKQVIDYMKNLIIKDKFLKSFEERDKETLFELFFKDYYSQIIISLINGYSDLSYNLLIYMIYLRFGIRPLNNSIDYYVKSILWIYIYKDEFSLLFKNFEIIKDKCPNIFCEVKEKIETQRIVYKVSSQHPVHKKLINKPFLLILDSFFLNLIEYIEKLNSSKILELIDIFSDIIQRSDIYDYNLQLNSKEFHNFKIIFMIIKFFKDKQINNLKDISLYIIHIKNESLALLENRINNVSEEINNQINFIYKILSNSEERTKIIMKIILTKYKEINEISYRELLCDFILEDSNLLNYSNEFFLNIINQFSFTPECLDERDIGDIDNPFLNSVIDNQYYPLLNIINEKAKIKFLEENLKYIFKLEIFNYYECELNSCHNNAKLEIDTYLHESSFDYFLRAHDILYEILNSKKEIPLKNIKKLFCLSYCNFYLEKFVFYLVAQKELVSLSRSNIIEFFNNKNNNIIKTFKLFILNELKTKYIMDKKEFLNIKKWTIEYFLEEELFKEIDFNILENDNMIKNIEYKYPFYSELLSIPIVKENNIKEFFKRDENAKRKYPILYSFLNTNKENLKYLKSFKEINNFVNYMREKYSYKISRDEAKYIKIKDEINNNNIPVDLFNNFYKAYKQFELYKITDKYNKSLLPPRELSKEDSLSFFLIDDGDLGHGMYLAAIYEKYILIQNNFLNDVIESINNNNDSNNKNLEYLKEKINEEINIHKANEYNILSSDITNESFYSLIFFYSYKDSFNNNLDFEHSKKIVLILI